MKSAHHIRTQILLLIALAAILQSQAVAQFYEKLYQFETGSGSIGRITQGADGNYYGATSSGGNGTFGTIFRMTPEGSVTTIHHFMGVDGVSPNGAFIQGNDGSFYGLTTSGGPAPFPPNPNGTVFKLGTDGTFTSIFQFQGTNGSRPSGGLVLGSDGSFYGVTSEEIFHRGSIFKVTSDGTLTTLVHFEGPNGSTPLGGLVRGDDGYLYGTTSQGGNGNCGTVYKMSADGVLATLVFFNLGNGATPLGSVVLGAGGYLYGTTNAGGANSCGTIFKVSPAGDLTTLFDFRTDSPATGAFPKCGLIQGIDGDFYGLTSSGGTGGYGTAFKVSSTGAFTKLADFNVTAQVNPSASLFQGSDGFFYGSTLQGVGVSKSTIFRLSPGGGATTLAEFRSAQGSNPRPVLVAGGDGYFYGTTFSGGDQNYGTIFRVTIAGAFTKLVDFTSQNGTNPNAGLIRGTSGDFYGTCSYGGTGSYGTVFKVTSTGQLTTIVNMDSGNPDSPLVQGADGRFYGMCSMGGGNRLGTIFATTEDGVFSTLSNFNGTNGASPTGGLVKGDDGQLYGVTEGGGSNGLGTVFKMAADGTLTTLANFSSSSGANPEAGLTLGSDGNFYGTTFHGGYQNYGTAFKMTPSGDLTTLVTFSLSNGAGPNARLAEGADGNFYGTTQYDGDNHGTVFRMTPQGGLSVLLYFDGSAQGNAPEQVVFDASGNLYGTAHDVIYRLEFGPAPVATIGNADSLTATSATVHGGVDANLDFTAITFIYGLSGLYGSSSASQDIGNQDQSIPVSATLTGLAPHSLYHYALNATNIAGVSNSPDATFNTANTQPIAHADSVDLAFGASASLIDVLSNDTDADGDTLAVTAVGIPAHGEAHLSGSKISYTAASGFVGADSFSYDISDGYGGIGSATLTVNVQPPQTPAFASVVRTGGAVIHAGLPGSGIPLGAVYRGFGPPAINNSAQVVFGATWSADEGSGSGIFFDDPLAGPKVIAIAHQAAPNQTGAPLGNLTFSSFEAPVLGEDGTVVFLAFLEGSWVTPKNNAAIFSTSGGTLHLVARTGDLVEIGAVDQNAPITGVFKSFQSALLQGNEILLSATLVGTNAQPGPGRVTSATNSGVWIFGNGQPGTPLLQKGAITSAAGAARVKSYRMLDFVNKSPGQYRFQSGPAGAGFAAQISYTDGTAAIVGPVTVRSGLAPSGIPAASLLQFGDPAIGRAGSGSLAYLATLSHGFGGVNATNDAAIFTGNGVVVARKGDATPGPGGRFFKAFYDPLCNSDGEVGFVATRSGTDIGPANQEAIFLQGHDTGTGERPLAILAEAGSPANGIPGAVFSTFQSVALPDLAGTRRLYFVAQVAKSSKGSVVPAKISRSNNIGLWAQDGAGTLRLILRSGSPIPVTAGGTKILTAFTVLGAVNGSTGQARSFNDYGALAFNAFFNDGSQELMTVHIP